MTRAGKAEHVQMGMHRVQVRANRRITPHLQRITVAADSLRDFLDDGPDQRFKLMLPQPHQSAPVLPAFTADWYDEWLATAADVRAIMRTYTIRAARPDRGEVDIDIVTHGDSGPGSRWARGAAAGDTAGLFGAYAEYDPDPRHRQLIAGDHTALPAIAAILERLPAEARATALIEVGPHDRLELDNPSNAQLTWVDACAQPGLALTAAIRALPAEPAYDYAWVAAERQPVAAIRRHLVRERGLAPEQIMFMGYWRSDGAIDELPQ